MVHQRSIGSTPGTPYEELVADHVIEVPENFNIAPACSDELPAGDVALIVHDEDGVQRLTFGDLTNRSARLAAGLREIGVMRGDRIGIVLPQRWEYVVALLAALRLGAITVPLSPQFGPEALRNRLKDCSAKVTIVDDSSIAAVREAGIGQVIHNREGRGSVRGLIGFHQPIEPVTTTSDEPAFLVYSSNRAGRPVGVVHGHRSLLGALPAIELGLDWFPAENDIVWTSMDWASMHGTLDVLLPSLYHGVPIVGSAVEFAPGDAVDLMAEESVTCAVLTTEALRSMSASSADFSRLDLRSALSVPDGVDAPTAAWAAEALGVTLNQAYGLPETNLAIGTSTSWETPPEAVGRPMPGFNVQLFDHEHSTIENGEPGRIAIHRGHPSEMLGYWNREEETAAAYEGDWLLTGDRATRDADGNLASAGRDDDAIATHGRRIGPTEIEACLLEDPAVQQAAVVQVPHNGQGLIIKAYVVTTERELATPETAVRLAGRCQERLAPFLAPKRISFVADLPTTATGRVRRSVLRTR